MPAPSLTTDEYLRGPETVLPQELVFGLVRNAPAPAPGHQWAVGDIYRCLWTHLHETRAGRVWMSPIDVVLDRRNGLIVQPDIVVVLNDRQHLVTDRIWGAPSLVIEISSPSLRIGALDERVGWFATYGVRECWLVRPTAGEIEVLVFEDRAIFERTTFGTGEQVRSRVLPQLQVKPDEVLT